MYETIKAQMAQAVPFAQTTGIALLEVGPGTAVAMLPLRTEVSNHIGSLHAGALFTLGETASGAAMSGAFAAQLMTIRPIATGASISYVKIAKGQTRARASVTQPVDQLLDALSREGRITFEIAVTLENEAAETVATMTVSWLVSRR